ncbi:PBECR4 domain-containing protein [Enterococcus casseliflavus]|nr:PBECR4 domain-containing protein [Enterococcus casseliflavus]
MAAHIRGLGNSYELALFDAATVFHDYLISFDYEYTYRDAQQKRKVLKISVKEENFMHLCGINCYGSETDYNNGRKNSSKFLSDCINRRLVLNNIWHESSKKIDVKLNAQKSLSMLTIPGVRVCGHGRFEAVEFDNALRTGRAIIALGIVGEGRANTIFNLALSKSDSKSISTSFGVTRIKKTHRVTGEITQIDCGISKKKSKKKTKKKNKITKTPSE